MPVSISWLVNLFPRSSVSLSVKRTDKGYELEVKAIEDGVVVAKAIGSSEDHAVEGVLKAICAALVDPVNEEDVPF